MMLSVLPPFANLIAFDAAARHGTFTRAASELNVSQPAVSRRIADLERDLGVRLFSRDTKPPRLTPVGQRLFEVLRSGLSRLEATIAEIRNEATGVKLTIAAAPGFMSFWLVPRLSELVQRFPDCDLRLMTSEHGPMMTQADIHVQFGAGDWPDVQQMKIMGEEVFAICSPLYLQNHSGFINAEGLQNDKLLQLSDSFERWYDWRSWFGVNDIPVKGKLTTLDFDNYSLLISAALAGEGVALCWSGLLDQYLDSGALVRLPGASLLSHRGYYVTCAHGAEPDSLVAQLMDWFAETAATVQG